MVKIELDSKTANELTEILNAARAEIHGRKTPLKDMTVTETYDRLRACETIGEKLMSNIGARPQAG